VVLVGLSIAAAFGLGFEQGTDAFKLVLMMGVLPSATINILMGLQAEDDMQPITLFVFCSTLWTAVLLPIAMVILF
jgi:predicted permease